MMYPSSPKRLESALASTGMWRSWRGGLLAVGLALAAFGGARAAEPTAGEAALLKADADFCRLCEAKGMAESFAECAAEDAVMLVPGAEPIKGKAGIREAMAGTEGLKLKWQPIRAEIARSGDLGYTYGNYQMSTPGGAVVRTGKYVTAWRKQADGAWKFVLDLGNADPPAAAPKSP